MTDSSNPRSVQPIKPVDPAACRMLRFVDRAATAVGSRYFVAGAMARDLLLVNTFGLPSGRATRDIDFGVAVESWEQFQALKGALIENRPVRCRAKAGPAADLDGSRHRSQHPPRLDSVWGCHG